MNHPDDNDNPFGQRLRALSPAPLPPEWRDAILAAATPPRQLIPFPGNPWAWTLAAAWIVIAALRLATPGAPARPQALAAVSASDPAFTTTLAYNELTLRNRLLARPNLEGGLP